MKTMKMTINKMSKNSMGGPSSTLKSLTCKECREQMPEQLLESDSASDSVSESGEANSQFTKHLISCAACATELRELQATFAVLDEWTAPEPSAYFDTRLHAQLREAIAAQPEGWWERTRTFLQFSTGRGFRPAVAGALGLVVLLGGLTFGGVYEHGAMVTASTPSATVNDLKILDKNAQALQQMDELLDDGGSASDDGAPPTT